MARFLLTAPGPRPAYFKLAEHLRGSGCEFDSDGNSNHPEATNWTGLTVILRAPPWQEDTEIERVDIDPVGDGEPLVLAITSDKESLARRAADFLNETAGGKLTIG